MIQKDKVMHFVVCYLIVVVGTIILKGCGLDPDRAVALASLSAFVIGIAKELWDKYVCRAIFDRKDIFADLLGIILSTLTICLT